jgi:hypothetical protein
MSWLWHGRLCVSLDGFFIILTTAASLKAAQFVVGLRGFKAQKHLNVPQDCVLAAALKLKMGLHRNAPPTLEFQTQPKRNRFH